MLTPKQVQAVRSEGEGEAPHLPAPHPHQQQHSDVEPLSEEEGGDGGERGGWAEEMLQRGR